MLKGKEVSTVSKTIMKRVNKEYNRMQEFFSKLGESQFAVVLPLMQNAAFMKVTLEELQNEIIENGAIDSYKNGENQYGTKASSSLQAYNSLIKNYATVQKQLTMLLPKEETEDDELLEFLRTK